MLQLGIINTQTEQIKSTELFNDLYSVKIIDSNIIDIETPNVDAFYLLFDFSIFDIISQLIKKRIPIFLDDFFKATIEQASTLLQLSHEAETFVQINSPLKHRKFNDILNTHFNNPRYISLHRKISNRSEDRLMQELFYEVDFITSKLNAQIKKIQSIYIPQNTESIHTIESRLEFNNGTVFHLFLTLLSAKEGYKIQVVKNENYLEIDFTKKSLDVSCNFDSKTLDLEDYNNEIDLFLSQLKDFQLVILENKRPLSDLESCLPTLEICKEIIAKLVY
jgi:hypothetical protein